MAVSWFSDKDEFYLVCLCGHTIVRYFPTSYSKADLAARRADYASRNCPPCLEHAVAVIRNQRVYPDPERDEIRNQLKLWGNLE